MCEIGETGGKSSTDKHRRTRTQQSPFHPNIQKTQKKNILIIKIRFFQREVPIPPHPHFLLNNTTYYYE